MNSLETEEFEDFITEFYRDAHRTPDIEEVVEVVNGMVRVTFEEPVTTTRNHTTEIEEKGWLLGAVSMNGRRLFFDNKSRINDLETCEEEIRKIARSIPNDPHEFDAYDLAIEIESLEDSLTKLAYDIRERLKDNE